MFTLQPVKKVCHLPSSFYMPAQSMDDAMFTLGSR